jgi:hypothetical protein
MSAFRVSWSGAEGGVDRPLDDPFLVLEHRDGGGWSEADSDLGLAFLWREQSGSYGAIYDIGPGVETGRYRVRISSGSYELASDPFRIVGSRALSVRGVELRRGRGGTRLVVRAQNPPPDPTQSIIWRSQSPVGGRAVIRVGGERLLARWSKRRQGWVAGAGAGVEEGDAVKVSVRDRFGNTSGRASRFAIGDLQRLDWPPNMGVGGGRTPGPFGEGTFPP